MLSINKVRWLRLREIGECLRKYVHGKDCEDIYTCPLDHNHRLSLDKSLAWSVADRLLSISEKESEIEMEDFLKETLMLYTTLKRHKEEYPELTQLVKEIYRACKPKIEVDTLTTSGLTTTTS